MCRPGHTGLTPATQSLHIFITEFCPMAKDVLTMESRKDSNRIRWQTMDKDHIPLSRLAEQYFITCRTEGKTDSTLRGYQEKLGRLVRWSEGVLLGDFSVNLIREYIDYLQTVPKYENHPYHTPNGELMSAANVRNHVRVLRAFSSWLYSEDLTLENRLARMKVPKAPRTILETLSEEEIKSLFACLDQDTPAGCRDAAILLLFLDTGLRRAELLDLSPDDVHVQEQWLKVMGKGQKERIVPFGTRASKLLQRYAHYFRPDSMAVNQLFLSVFGSPLTGNTVRLIR